MRRAPLRVALLAIAVIPVVGLLAALYTPPETPEASPRVTATSVPPGSAPLESAPLASAPPES